MSVSLQQLSIEQRIQYFVDLFQQQASWEDRYKKIIEIGKDLPEIPSQYRTEQDLVKGCQSQVWLHASMTADGKMVLFGDSDALLVKGLVGIVLGVYSGSAPVEILKTPPDFLRTMGFEGNLTPSRANGLNSMIRQVMLFATAFKLVQSSS